MDDMDKIINGVLNAERDARTSADRLPEETRLRRRILERFPVLETRLHILNRHRLALDSLSRRDFEKVFRFLCGDGGFSALKMINAYDAGENMVVNYVLYNNAAIMLLVKQRVPKSNAAIRTVCDRFPYAVWDERALVDLFGITVEGLPAGPSYPLVKSWPRNSYPMRREWNVVCFDRDTMRYTGVPSDDEAGFSEPQL